MKTSKFNSHFRSTSSNNVSSLNIKGLIKGNKTVLLPKSSVFLSSSDQWSANCVVVRRWSIDERQAEDIWLEKLMCHVTCQSIHETILTWNVFQPFPFTVLPEEVFRKSCWVSFAQCNLSSTSLIVILERPALAVLWNANTGILPNYEIAPRVAIFLALLISVLDDTSGLGVVTWIPP